MSSPNCENVCSSNSNIECSDGVDKSVSQPVTDESMADGPTSKANERFMSGVVEGFYGRPWTAEQRKELFTKMQRWRLNTYLYAPKDDYKHRACWREPYSVDEAEHLAALISCARQHCVTFVYGLSPGVDITYSSAKDKAALRHKLEQVAGFGCGAFALLFDDIDSDMRHEDKAVFQSFAHAQVSVANEMNENLSRPVPFLFCPTQYCASRAVPSVLKSEYLTTIGTRLADNIDIMWTGPQVISKQLTVESIEVLTEVLRRPPVIWDNLHANDYDQKRLFMGPYSGRPVELKQRLRGVLTNPNCEFGVNFVAIRTLSLWCQSTRDAAPLPQSADSVSSDIRLETEQDSPSLPPLSSCFSTATTTSAAATTAATTCNLTCSSGVASGGGGGGGGGGVPPGVYHPREALRQALREWLPEFRKVRVVRSPLPVSCPTVVPTALLANAGMSACVVESPVSSAPVVVQPLGSSRVAKPDEVADKLPGAILNSLADNEQIVVSAPCTASSSTIAASLSPPVTTAAAVCPLGAEPGVPPATTGEEPMECSSTAAAAAAAADTAVLNDTSTADSGDCNETEPMAVESAATATATATAAINSSGAANCAHSGADGGGDDSPPSTAEMAECGVTQQCSPAMSVEEAEESPVQSLAASATGTGTVTSAAAGAVAGAAAAGGGALVAAVVTSAADVPVDSDLDPDLTEEDLLMLADLFYLPFEHGEAGLHLLHQFQWLKMHSSRVTPQLARTAAAAAAAQSAAAGNSCSSQQVDLTGLPPEVGEWYERAGQFDRCSRRVTSLLKRLFLCENRSLLYDIYAYIWDVECVLSQLNGYVKWLVLGCSCSQSSNYVVGNYTWFTRGWKESFTSGDSEPWIFRGGLTGDLERLLPVDHAADLLVRVPDLPLTHVYVIRPYRAADEPAVMRLWEASSPDTHPSFQQHPQLSFHRYVWPYLLLEPDHCLIMENDNDECVGFVATAPSLQQMRRKQLIAWLPEMRLKYPLPVTSATTPAAAAAAAASESLQQQQQRDGTDQETEQLSPAQRCVHQLHSDSEGGAWLQLPAGALLDRYPGSVRWSVSPDSGDGGLTRRLLACALATLRASGCFGAHCAVPTNHTAGRQQLSAATFQELETSQDGSTVYYGRQC